MKHYLSILSTLVLLLGISLVSKADKKNVLFIGNSYTGVNNLPQLIFEVSNSLGDTLTFDSDTPGGKTANAHWNDATTKAKISQGGWDYVVIQCQSQEPSFSPNQVMNQTYPFVKSLDSLAKATNNCAEVLYYMTWGRKNGDAANCPFYSPICTYEGMQNRLRESYLLFAQDFNSSVAPVGAAWKVVRDSIPALNLYTADESHPSINGSYLAACIFYSSIFKKPCLGSQYLPGGVGNGDAFAIQNIADKVVLDSLENWQSHGAIPDASFTYTSATPPPANFFTFTNTSLRYATSSWDFGDGSPTGNPATNPVHPFPTSGGTYKVCLTVTSACGKKDSSCQTVVVGPTSINNSTKNTKVKIGQSADFISIDCELNDCLATLTDVNGRTIIKQVLKNGGNQLPISNYSRGMYILNVSKSGQTLLVKKIDKQ